MALVKYPQNCPPHLQHIFLNEYRISFFNNICIIKKHKAQLNLTININTMKELITEDEMNDLKSKLIKILT